ncbi:RTA1 like protein-domain-containing protein [Gilbertella persicaria]|nr:RTA1 like protein-domain-containing protein [Gilbertella persicaria]KAI8066249.1 RTA1 like protein-domain-containing protein [Gilbertella persicaria]
MLFFHYIPNLSLAIVGLCVYAIFTIYLTARMYLSKSPKFLYILAFTGLMETVGYAVRIACHYFTDLGRYVGMTLFLLLAPNALALVNYKTVGEVIRLSNVETNKFYIKPKFVTWFFFSSDIFSFVLQGAGGGMQTSVDLNTIGRAITLVGLGLQLVFFACFAGITVYVHLNPQYQYHVKGQPNAKKYLLLCLYVTIFLLYIRSIYRVAEYASGYGGPIASSEWAFYVFDTLVIAISFAVYCVFFIGNYLPKHNSSLDSILNSNETQKMDIEDKQQMRDV